MMDTGDFIMIVVGTGAIILSLAYVSWDHDGNDEP